MIQVKPQLTPEAQQTLLDIERMPAAMGDAMAVVMDQENELSIGHISQRYLSSRGPRSLGVRTNRLRSSLRRAKARSVSDLGVVSSIGSNVVYLGVHEFGFKGTVNVRSHTRRVTQAFGRILSAPTSVSVSSHKRKVDIPERAPLRRGVTDRMNHYVRSISEAITETAKA